MSFFRTLAACGLVFCTACGDDDAVSRGVGAECASDADCTEEGQRCLTQFRGGMCGIADCTTSADCPSGSVCVEDPEAGGNLCLLACVDKPECNVHRSVENESNCVSTLNPVDPPDGGTAEDTKVCRPPLSG